MDHGEENEQCNSVLSERSAPGVDVTKDVTKQVVGVSENRVDLGEENQRSNSALSERSAHGMDDTGSVVNSTRSSVRDGVRTVTRRRAAIEAERRFLRK